jgi:hypothetical protein
MQAGFTRQPQLGTPVTADLAHESAAIKAVKNSLPYKLFERTRQKGIPLNEREALFRKTPVVMKGMTFTHVPNGGFSRPKPPRIIIGASEQGLDCYVRHTPTHFSGDSPSKFVGPAADIPGFLTSSADPMYRAADAKPRSSFASVGRMQREAERGKAKLAERYKQYFDIDDTAPSGSTPVLASTSTPDPVPALPQPSVQFDIIEEMNGDDGGGYDEQEYDYGRGHGRSCDRDDSAEEKQTETTWIEITKCHVSKHRNTLVISLLCVLLFIFVVTTVVKSAQVSQYQEYIRL